MLSWIGNNLGTILITLVLIAVVAAILTPPDVVSQCMLGLPMYLLYEIAAQVARFVKPKQKIEA